MKRFLNLLLFISSFFGYLEWGNKQHRFIFELEYELFFTLPDKTNNFSHPLILVPLIGQILILITLFQKEPGKRMTNIAIGCMGLLMLFLFAIGIMGKNPRILAGATPFLLISIIIIIYQRTTQKHMTQHEKI